MFCTSCGKEIEDGAVFCTHCGTKQTQEGANTNDLSRAEPAEVVPGNAEPKENDIPDQALTAAVTDSHEVKPANGTKSDFTSTTVNSNKKKSNSSVVVIGVVAVAVIAALFLLFGKGSGYKDYKDLAQNYYNAIYDKDFNALLKCYDKQDQKDMKDDKENIQKELKYLKKDFDDRYSKGWNKKIKTSGRTKIDSEDDTIFYSVTVEINKKANQFLAIKKYKNKYYIDASRNPF